MLTAILIITIVADEDIDEQIENDNSSSEVINPHIEDNHSETINLLDSEEVQKLTDNFIKTHRYVKSSTQNITNSETSI